MNITANYLRKVTNEEGDIEVTFQVSNYRDKEVIKGLEKEVPYRIEYNVIKSKRSIEQNKMLWTLIHEISVARGTERANDDWDIYIEALKRAGAKFEYIAVLPEAEGLLRENFRAIKYTNSFEHKGKTFNSYKAYYGSSKMNTKEMTLLLETVIDMATEEGIQLMVNDYEEKR